MLPQCIVSNKVFEDFLLLVVELPLPVPSLRGVLLQPEELDLETNMLLDDIEGHVKR